MAVMGHDQAVLAAMVLLNEMRTERALREVNAGAIKQVADLAQMSVADLVAQSFAAPPPPLTPEQTKAAVDVILSAVELPDGQAFGQSQYRQLPATPWPGARAQPAAAPRPRLRIPGADTVAGGGGVGRRRSPKNPHRPDWKVDPFGFASDIVAAWMYPQIGHQVRMSRFPWWWGKVDGGPAEIKSHLEWEMNVVRAWRFGNAQQKQTALANLSAAWQWVNENQVGPNRSV